MVFDTDQAGFLAGYVAAAMTETGVVGTWGGINIPPVSVFMDGFLAGVNHHNAVKGTSVAVLGWDGSDGVFIGSFEAQDLGNSATADMLQNGADIILPVAGPAGLGAATAIQDFGSGSMIWVDTDGFALPDDRLDHADLGREEDGQRHLRPDQGRSSTARSPAALYVGTLANDGVGISPFHDFDASVPDD
jgi:basic membrane protein A and related proteins